MTKLAVIIVSANSAAWLPGCLTSVQRHAGAFEALDIVVVDSGSTDETRDVVARFPAARVVSCANHGFAYANNRGLALTDADWILFLNPDTEIIEGTLADLVASADEYPDCGIFGVRQVWPDRTTQFTIRRFSSVRRWLGEALVSESWPIHPSWAGERELDESMYLLSTPCDWTSGSCMLVRRAVIDRIGGMDERFFLFCEEPDFCLRARAAGYRTRHLPCMTIIHHGGSESSSPRLASQLAISRRLYAKKHMSRPRQVLAVASLTLGYALRAVAWDPRARPSASRRKNSRAALATLLGLREPPFARETRG